MFSQTVHHPNANGPCGNNNGEDEGIVCEESVLSALIPRFFLGQVELMLSFIVPSEDVSEKEGNCETDQCRVDSVHNDIAATCSVFRFVVEDGGEHSVKGEHDQDEETSGFSGVEVVSVEGDGIERMMSPDICLVTGVLDGLLTEPEGHDEEDKDDGNTEPDTVGLSDGDFEKALVAVVGNSNA